MLREPGDAVWFSGARTIVKVLHLLAPATHPNGSVADLASDTPPPAPGDPWRRCRHCGTGLTVMSLWSIPKSNS